MSCRGSVGDQWNGGNAGYSGCSRFTAVDVAGGGGAALSVTSDCSVVPCEASLGVRV